MAADSAGHAGHADGPEAVRLALLTSADEDMTGVDALTLAVQQATAALGGLGGLAHRRDPATGLLRLVAVCGLTSKTAEPWVTVRDENAGPARAVREAAYVWQAEGGTGTGAAGTASVPLTGPDGPVGALSVLTVGPGEPDRGRQAFLHSVAAWAAHRLATLPEPVTGPPPPGILLDMGDGFLAVDEDWRITVANREAERLLGVDHLAGRVLWGLPASRTGGLEGHCRRAVAEGTAVDHDLRWPTDQRLYRVRLAPVKGSGMAISFADVTDRRLLAAGNTAEERRSAERTARMGELTVALAEAVTSRDVVRAVARHVLPPFGADGLVVEALDGGRVRVVDSVGYSEEFLRRLDEVPLAANTVVADVLGTRAPRFIESPGEFVRLYPDQRSLAVTSAKGAWAFLPLVASGRATGCCVVTFARPRSFSAEDRTLLTALSGLVAQALERARLYDAESARTRGLQRGLLPRELPSLAGVSAAARYLPAGRGDEVGGDWYDVIPLSADRVALVVGDVMGHGITEAATMGRLRTAVRTLADLELDPDELLTHLNELVGELGHDYYATCLYAVFDPVTRSCSFALAGHPPPLVVHPDGTVHTPDLPVNPPLGAAEPPFDVLELTLPEECLLVLCTDGLVESPTRDVDQGLALLRQTVASAVARAPYFSADGAERLDELCDLVVSTLIPDREQTTDDAALLVARTRCTPAQDIASCSLPEDPRAAGQAREYVRRQLAVWGLDDLAMTTELLVSELVGNVVRHAKGPIRLRLMRSRSLICEVYDGSLTTPRIRRAGHTDEGGRGLHLVAAVSDRWGTRFLGDGKCIWAEQDIPVADRPRPGSARTP
ncbi:SpoIIE family protein phosphatase [Streptomyces sp. NPDC087903]|uniref:ATP-binding SpoIIE family protein phosphatase n=1 Tax=Streptomyces sp. NPDC087903 TaxID=3365819 RepID=UPI00382D913B